MKFRSFHFRMTWGCVLWAALSVASKAEDESEVVPAQPSAPAASAEESRPEPTDAEIAGWIGELDDNRYLVREQATQRLLETGVPALDPLLEAANGDRPERADRALFILRRLATTGEPSTRRAALGRLVRVANRPQLSAAAQQALSVLQHQEAVAAIEKLGGRFQSSQVVNPQAAMNQRATELVILDSNWRGGDAGLVHLADLLGLRQVIIVGTDITPQGLSQLQRVGMLEDLWLFGTKVKPEDLPEVRSQLSNVRIDYRRGGFLGVGASTIDGVGPAVVNRVQPDSAAAAAGIKVGDVIQTFNGQPVTSFKDLTSKIGNCGAGEEIKLDLLRDGKPLSLTIKLGEWQTI